MNTLLAYREDGPLARTLGRAHVPAPASLLTLLSLMPLLAAILANERSTAVTTAVLAWTILLGGLSRGADLDRDRFRWVVPPLLRAAEYSAYVWLNPKGALPLLIVLAFHHYDIVYRLRYQGRVPPNLGAGWDTRLVLAAILYAANALPAGFWIGAGILGALFVAESVASWRRFSAVDAPAIYDDTEGDAE